jgi:hypothetical protein
MLLIDSRIRVVAQGNCIYALSPQTSTYLLFAFTFMTRYSDCSSLELCGIRMCSGTSG